jgi:hypothetical protein
MSLPAESDTHPLMTRYSRQRSGTPLSSCSPASSNLRPLPPTRSITVRRDEDFRRPGLSRDPRANDDAIPLTFSAIVSTSPVCTPARRSSPRGRTASTAAFAQRTALAGPSKVAKKPSPAVSISLPWWRSSSALTRTLWAPRSWIPVVVVAVGFPEAGLVRRPKLESSHPFSRSSRSTGAARACEPGPRAPGRAAHRRIRTRPTPCRP